MNTDLQEHLEELRQATRALKKKAVIDFVNELIADFPDNDMFRAGVLRAYSKDYDPDKGEN